MTYRCSYLNSCLKTLDIVALKETKISLPDARSRIMLADNGQADILHHLTSWPLRLYRRRKFAVLISYRPGIINIVADAVQAARKQYGNEVKMSMVS